MYIPKGDRLLCVKETIGEQTTAAGIILPDLSNSTVQKQDMLRVIAVGDSDYAKTFEKGDLLIPQEGATMWEVHVDADKRQYMIINCGVIICRALRESDPSDIFHKLPLIESPADAKT